MSIDEKIPVLSMLDLTLREFDDLYYSNEKLFRSVNNWFYFANDRKVSSLSVKGYVCYGRNRGRTRSYGFPEDGYGGLVLLCRSDADVNRLREKCEGEKKGVVPFQLNDGTEAHYGIVKDTIGAWGPGNAEYPLLIVPNKPQTKNWPYSMKGNTTFDKAGKEEGTLPYDVATSVIERLLPDTIKEIMGIPIRP